MISLQRTLFNMHTIIAFFYTILLLLVSIYIFLLVTRLIALFRLSKFFGAYAHITPAGEKPDDVTFIVSYNWSTFLSPLPGITIGIRRSSAGDSLHNDWHGWFTSDIIFLYYFKGRYELENPDPNDTFYGWHHLYLFEKPDTRIILNLQYLKDNKQIISDEGYYIVKK